MGSWKYNISIWHAMFFTFHFVKFIAWFSRCSRANANILWNLCIWKNLYTSIQIIYCWIHFIFDRSETGQEKIGLLHCFDRFIINEKLHFFLLVRGIKTKNCTSPYESKSKLNFGMKLDIVILEQNVKVGLDKWLA